jgi:hypothetical protein
VEKVCTKCKESKPCEEFHKNARYKCGYNARCKVCMKQYVQENESHEWKLAARKRYREKNRERIRQQDREAYRENPDKFRAKAREAQKRYFQTPKGREKYRLEGLKLRKLYPEKARARSLLSNAICEGKIIRPSACSLCGTTETKIQAHHPDYSKTYDVIWVCRSCHFMVHDRIKIRAERLNPETSKEDVIVQPGKETSRGNPEAEGPPSIDGQ